jgi:hypothetical protein
MKLRSKAYDCETGEFICREVEGSKGILLTCL